MVVQGGSSASQITMKDSGGTVDGYVYAESGSVGFLDDDGAWALLHTTDTRTTFLINNSEKMRIESGGDVGIGTTDPDDRLHVNGGHLTIQGSRTSAQITFKGSDGTIDGYIYGQDANIGLLDQTGHWAYKHTHDTQHTWYIDNGTRAILNNSGVLSITGTLTENYSDDRLKTSKANITGALTKGIGLNGFTYRPTATAQALGYKDEQDVGVSAQEVEAVLPEAVVLADAVNADHGTDYKTVQSPKLIPLLIEAIKELKTELDAAKARIAELEK